MLTPPILYIFNRALGGKSLRNHVGIQRKNNKGNRMQQWKGWWFVCCCCSHHSSPILLLTLSPFSWDSLSYVVIHMSTNKKWKGAQGQEIFSKTFHFLSSSSQQGKVTQHILYLGLSYRHLFLLSSFPFQSQ